MIEPGNGTEGPASKGQGVFRPTKQKATAASRATNALERTNPLLRSCERCRRRKQKCDREQPICGRCKGHNAECIYKKSEKFGKRSLKSKPTAPATVFIKPVPTPAATTTVTAATTAVTTAATTATVSPTAAVIASTTGISSLPLQQPSPIVFSLPEQLKTAQHSRLPNYIPLQTLGTGTLGILVANTGASPVPSSSGSNTAPLDNGEGTATPPIASQNPAFVDPVAILRTQNLPDLTEDLTNSAVRQMYALLEYTNSYPQSSGTIIEAQPHASLQQPQASALRASSADTPGERRQTLEPEAATNSGYKEGGNSGGGHTHEPSAQTAPKNTAMDVPQALVDAARRHAINEDPQLLLMILRLAFINGDMMIRTPEFWATLEAGNISDFVVLTHLAIAAREVQLSNAMESLDFQSILELEFLCYEAAKQEWYDGKATNSVGVVVALLLLSEYAYHTGRHNTMWEYSQYALDVSRSIEFRNTRYPWKSARKYVCDLEYENVIRAFWNAWGRLTTAAQRMTRRIQLMDANNLPEYPVHPCRYVAQVFVEKGVTKQDCVEFGQTECVDNGYSIFPASAQSCYMLALMHNRYIDLLEGKISTGTYLSDLKAWDKKLYSWRSTWPEIWDLQVQVMLNKAQRISKERYNSRIPLENSLCHMRSAIGAAADRMAGNATHSAGAGIDTLASPESSPATNDIESVPADRGSEEPALESTASQPGESSNETKAGLWMIILYSLYEIARLRVHRIALVYMNSDELQPLNDRDPSMRGFHSSALPTVPAGYKYVSEDPLADSIAYHHSKFECTDAANNLQSLFNMADVLGYPLDLLGVWVVYILEHLISIECTRVASNDWSTKTDALKRLARLLRQLLARKKWTSALYVFASVVQTYIDNRNTIDGGESIASENSKLAENSSWPQNHILTILMRLMRMDPVEFCAYTLPLAFASTYTTAALPPNMSTNVAGLTL